jgi:Kdo2-lipid IVA lauroyltransferase/acyltransferase
MSGWLRAIRHELGIAGLRALLGTAALAPLAWHRGWSRWVGRLALTFAQRERQMALQHIASAFPEHDETWHRRLLAGCARHLGLTLGEVAWLWSVRAAHLLERTEIVGLQNLTDCLTPSSGALLVTGHCGNWEWLNLALGAVGVPMTVVAREVFDPRLDEIAQRLRGRFGGETALRGKGAGAKLVQALRRGRVLGLLIDQDIDAPGAFVEFFGRPAWTPTGAALLALRTGAPLVTGFARRLPDGTMQLSFDPPITPQPHEDLDADAALLTARLTRRIEEQIRSAPEQWVWMHRRWRRQPEAGEPVWRADGLDQLVGSLTPEDAGGGATSPVGVRPTAIG